MLMKENPDRKKKKDIERTIFAQKSTDQKPKADFPPNNKYVYIFMMQIPCKYGATSKLII